MKMLVLQETYQSSLKTAENIGVKKLMIILLALSGVFGSSKVIHDGICYCSKIREISLAVLLPSLKPRSSSTPLVFKEIIKYKASG